MASTLLDKPAVGVLGGLGALYAGLASYGGVYHARFRLMAATALVIGFATALGIWAGPNYYLSLAAISLFGLVFALYAASGPAASTLGVQGCAVLVVFSGLGLPTSTAVSNGLVVLGGAALQVFLLTVVWPFNPNHPERMAVADAIDSLAAFVLEPEGAKIPASQLFQEARAILDQADEHQWRREHDVLLSVIQRAESVRAALVGWARADEVYRTAGRLEAIRSRRIARSIHRALHGLAVSVRRHGVPDPALLRLPRIEDDDPASADFAHWISVVARLIKHVSDSGQGVPSLSGSTSSGTVFGGLFSAVTRLPDVAALRSVSLQHAVRYASTLGLAALLARVSGVGHAYWFPLTVALVLRPDFGTTFTRGLGRLVGTLGGVVLATLVIDAFHPGPPVLLGLMVVGSWLAFGLFQTGYAAYSVAITMYVVFSVAAAGVAANGIGVTRVAATICGVALSFVAYLVWPVLHWKQFWQVLRDSVTAHLEYGEAVSRADDAAVDVARVKARGLRIQSENLLRSATLDPWVRGSAALEEATAATQKLDENAAEVLTLEAARAVGSTDVSKEVEVVMASSRELATVIDRHLAIDAPNDEVFS